MHVIITWYQSKHKYERWDDISRLPKFQQGYIIRFTKKANIEVAKRVYASSL